MVDPGRSIGAAGRPGPIVRIAPAKLNLTLAVVARRPDGYHEIHSVMVPLALADRLSVSPAATSHDTLRVEGPDTGPIADNLVLRAFAVTRAAADRVAQDRAAQTFPLAARLEKRIPVAAGLAGGSSDAAAAMDVALEAWGLLAPGGGALDDAIGSLRRTVAARVGSDVPFFLAGGPALVQGRGERVTALTPIRGGAPGVLLVTPAVPAPSATVFAALDAAGAARPADSRSTRLTSEHLALEIAAGLQAASLVARAGVLASANDLAAAAGVVVGGLLTLRRALSRSLGRPVGVSGSGPTLWVLYPSAKAAEAAAAVVLAGLGDGSIVAPGDGPPAVIATALAGTPPDEPTSTITTHAAEGRT